MAVAGAEVGRARTEPHPKPHLLEREGSGCAGVIKRTIGIHVFSKQLSLQGRGDVWIMTPPNQWRGRKAHTIPASLGQDSEGNKSCSVTRTCAQGHTDP